MIFHYLVASDEVAEKKWEEMILIKTLAHWSNANLYIIPNKYKKRHLVENEIIVIGCNDFIDTSPHITTFKGFWEFAEYIKKEKTIT